MNKLVALYCTPKDAKVNYIVAEGNTMDFAAPFGYVVEHNCVDGEIGGSYKSGYPLLHESNFRNLEGKMLTICDATFSDKEQREAFKRIIKNELRNWFSDEIDNVIGISNGQFKCVEQ